MNHNIKLLQNLIGCGNNTDKNNFLNYIDKSVKDDKPIKNVKSKDDKSKDDKSKDTLSNENEEEKMNEIIDMLNQEDLNSDIDLKIDMIDLEGLNEIDLSDNDIIDIFDKNIPFDNTNDENELDEYMINNEFEDRDSEEYI